jgi:glycosyltransferase involved in cell wall biosynthesis
LARLENKQDDKVAAMDGIQVSVVMPCLNEAETIDTCVAWALEGIARSGLVGEVVVSDNGSTDGSTLIAENAGARVVHQPLRGYGNAYLKGFAEAKGDIIVMGDSDATYDFRQLPELIAPLADGADYVLGSRMNGTILPGAMPWLHRYVGNPVLTFILNRFFGHASSDAHSGMRAFTREAYERMDLRCEGMEFASEVVIKAAREGLVVAEIPIVYHARGGESKLRTFRDGWRHLRFMLLACPKYLFFIPGALMFALGMIGQTALLRGPMPLRFHSLDVHFSALFALLAIVGFQTIVFGAFAKVIARAQGFDRTNGFDSWLEKDFTLERGLLTGLMVFAFGFAIDAWILVEWLRRGRGSIDEMRPALFALSMMAVGAQIMFAAFFISLIGQSRRWMSPASRREDQLVTA